MITSPVRFIPEEVERSVMFIELRQPDVVELDGVHAGRCRDCRRPEPLSQFANALQGLTLDEPATRCAARLAGHRAGTRIAAGSARREAPAGQSQRRDRIYFGGTNSSEIGGLEGLKTWLLERRKLFQMRDTLESKSCPKAC